MSTDIISCVPWNLVESSVSHNQDSHISAQQSKLVKLLSLVCLVKILKLIRILRTPDFVAKVEVWRQYDIYKLHLPLVVCHSVH